MLREFLENEPLYRPTELPSGFTGYDYWPKKITALCKVDGGPRPYRVRSGFTLGADPVRQGLHQLHYTCTECEQSNAYYFVLGYIRDDNEDPGYLEKVGQYPAWSTTVPRRMRKFLGTSEPIYKNALISLSVGFGIGALAYMRRIVEDKARDILLLLADIQEAEGSPAGDVKETRELAEGRQVDPILKRAAELLPASLRPGGQNPLDRIYDAASGGIHAGTGDEAVSHAMAIKVALEYVVPRLQGQIDDKQAYLDAMRKLDDGR